MNVIQSMYNYFLCIPSKNEDENITNKVEVSYIEIYNEKVRDLLCPRGYVQEPFFQQDC